MNEALWPSQKESDAFNMGDAPAAVKRVYEEILSGVEIEKSVRYVDEEG
jgi:hypothetical protein